MVVGKKEKEYVKQNQALITGGRILFKIAADCLKKLEEGKALS